MKPFLLKVAEDIAGSYSNDTGRVCIVLPNRRAGLYLRKYLAAVLKKTVWAPGMFSMEDFITSISGYSIMDSTGLLFELYAIHREIAGKDAQEFELFAEWAQVLLKDFDEIDQYLADPEKVFSFLDEARALAVWNLGERPLTEHEQDYLRFYRSFSNYYFRLKERLMEKRKLYQGLAYRLAAENISSIASGFEWKKVFFAGLNALATSEEKIIDHLLIQNKAEIYWDADEYYINDRGQEAGDFIRKHLQKWPRSEIKWLEKEFGEAEKRIHIYGIPKNTGQAIKAGQIIRQIAGKAVSPDNTALVLADESLLLPVLYSLPDNIGPVNVTMGFPFRFTNLYQFFYLLFSMHEHADRFAAGPEKADRKYYARDILKILSHPYLFLWCDQVRHSDDPDLLSDMIRRKNRIHFHAEEILCLPVDYSDSFRLLIKEIFDQWSTPQMALERCIRLMDIIRMRMSYRTQEYSFDHTLDFEHLYHLARVIRRCKNLLEEYPFIQTLQSLRKVLFQILDQDRLPFYGEPLRGLQVMGVLETRSIDFENIIVLSVNEGILPSGRTAGSFLPFDIKYAFGLPTFQQRDAVFAYHFYRMIQRASHICLLYDTEGDAMKGGEKSRYVTQIIYELKKSNPRIQISENLISPDPPASGRADGLSMPKTPRIRDILKERCEKGFSPSALNLFIRCPLQFYFREILGISEAEEMEETIENKTLGTVIHDVLRRIYEPFVGKYVEPEQLKARLSALESCLAGAFGVHYPEGDLDHGKNHLAYRVSQFLVSRLIRFEADQLALEEKSAKVLHLLHLEEKLESTVTCRSGNENLPVRIKGTADRIDRWGEVTRIIDYKTGPVRQSDLKIRSWGDIAKNPRMGKAFQLLVYAWLYDRRGKQQDGMLQAGNITLRRISEYVMQVKLPEDQLICKETMELFERILMEVLEKILDPDLPFDQTEEPEICSGCSFRPICSR